MTEDKVTYTFINMTPVADDVYKQTIQTFYEGLITAEKLFKDLPKDNITPEEIEKILQKNMPVLVGATERLEKGEYLTQCEVIEEHKILCIIDKDVASKIPPFMLDLFMKYLVPLMSLVPQGYICPVCGKVFRTVRGFRAHYARKHRVKKNDESESSI
mgnify:CR=1 FL=1